jgi:uncharacterized protein with LGFP repeats
VPDAGAELHVDRLLNVGLPSSVLDSLTAGSSTGSISTERLTSALRETATAASAGGLRPEIADLLGRVGRASSPLDAATQLINYKYAQLGSSSGFLGSPTTAVTASTDGVGFFRSFNGGAIYWHPATGAHEVHGAIRVKWVELGAERGFLGYPVTDQTPGRDAQSRGAFNHFQRGSIFWHPSLIRGVNIGAAAAVGTSVAASTSGGGQPPSPVAAPLLREASVGMAAAGAAAVVTASPGAARVPALSPSLVGIEAAIRLPVESSAGAHEVHGAIRAKYLALGGETSILGYPTSDEQPTPGGTGRVSHFESGDIDWTTATGAAEVHGLIRDFWTAHAAERGAFGYPITDELIPDRRLGHVRPETRRKPVVGLPADVVKLPADARPLGFPRAVVNATTTAGASGLSAVTAARLAPAAASAGLVASEVIAAGRGASDGDASGRLRAGIDTAVVAGALLTSGVTEASSEAPVRSLNRFQDFEGAVLFWRRGAASAVQLAPWLQATDGTTMHWTAEEVLGAARPAITQAFRGVTGMGLAGLSFAGTTSYSFDGANVHNRRHRLLATLTGGLLGIIPMPVTVEIHVEAAFEPLARKVVAYLANWVPLVVPPLNVAPMDQLHRVLDPVLWTEFDLAQLPDTDDGNPIALLSVKTLTNGDVNVFIEPAALRLAVSPDIALGDRPITAIPR